VRRPARPLESRDREAHRADHRRARRHSEVLDRPAEFQLYLQRRTDPGVSKYFWSSDELDLFMLFLRGGLYVEPNPPGWFRFGADLLFRLARRNY
jgi:hypothetical protein